MLILELSLRFLLFWVRVWLESESTVFPPRKQTLAKHTAPPQSKFEGECNSCLPRAFLRICLGWFGLMCSGRGLVAKRICSFPPANNQTNTHTHTNNKNANNIQTNSWSMQIVPACQPLPVSFEFVQGLRLLFFLLHCFAFLALDVCVFFGVSSRGKQLIASPTKPHLKIQNTKCQNTKHISHQTSKETQRGPAKHARPLEFVSGLNLCFFFLLCCFSIS